MSKELEDRFLRYAMAVRDFCKKLKHDYVNGEYIKQLIRSSASVGANYIEASDDLGKADEKMRIKIARRESKESIFFLGLVLTYKDEILEKEKSALVNEGTQIKKILSAILIKLENKP